jgi:hypothetical protein
MSKSSFVSSLVILALCTSFAPLMGQGPPPPSIRTLEAARVFLHTTYPETLHQGFNARVTADVGYDSPWRIQGFGVHVSKGTSTHSDTPEALENPILHGSFQFDWRDRFQSFDAVGQLVRSTENRHLAAEVYKRKDWSEADYRRTQTTRSTVRSGLESSHPSGSPRQQMAFSPGGNHQDCRRDLSNAEL